MKTKEDKYFTFFDLLKKIVKYWYISVFSIIIFCSSAFFFEKNKTIYNTATLSILPLSIVEYKQLFSASNFNITDSILNINATPDVDSFYSLEYTPLSLLFAYSLKAEEIIFKQNIENEIYKELTKKTKLTLGSTDSQIFLFVYVKSTRNKDEITKYLNWFGNEANSMTKNNIISLIKKEIKETQNKINLLNEINSKDNVRMMSNYQIKILDLEDILAQPNKIIYFNVQNTSFKNNSFKMYKIMLFSFLIASMLSLITIMFIPDRKN